MMKAQVAIIETNTLAAIGLKHLLQNVLPMLHVDTFFSPEEIPEDNYNSYAHFFVAMPIALSHRKFFQDRQRQTIVLTTSANPNAQLGGLKCIPINVPEEELLKSFLKLEQRGHPQGKNLPQMPHSDVQNVLSDREIEVLTLIVKGYINKEIASQLNIGITTVITHRKNIMDKLGIRNISSLTIYAVMHGYVEADAI